MKVSSHIKIACVGAMVWGSQVNAQTYVSSLEPTEPVLLEIDSLEDFQKTLNVLPKVISKNAPNVAVSQTTGLTVVADKGRLTMAGPFPTNSGSAQYILSLIDEVSGAPLTIAPKNITLSNNGQSINPYVIDNFPKADIRTGVVILADSSGSMGGFLPELIDSANALFEQLPDHMSCRALVFESTHYWVGDPDGPCTPDAIGLHSISAGGGTMLYEALKEAYTDLHSRNYRQTIVIVLTDGMPSSIALKDEIERLRNGIPTLFFWLGNTSPEAEELFGPLADSYVSDPNGAWQYLKNYFAVYAEVMNKQAVITIEPQP